MFTSSYQVSSDSQLRRQESVCILAGKQGSGSQSSSSSSSQLRHITEEKIEEAVDESNVVSDDQDTTNDTSDQVLHYFAHVTNHYLCLVKGNPKLNSQHDI